MDVEWIVMGMGVVFGPWWSTYTANGRGPKGGLLVAVYCLKIQRCASHKFKWHQTGPSLVLTPGSGFQSRNLRKVFLPGVSRDRWRHRVHIREFFHSKMCTFYQGLGSLIRSSAYPYQNVSWYGTQNESQLGLIDVIHRPGSHEEVWLMWYRTLMSEGLIDVIQRLPKGLYQLITLIWFIMMHSLGLVLCDASIPGTT